MRLNSSRKEQYFYIQEQKNKQTNEQITQNQTSSKERSIQRIGKDKEVKGKSTFYPVSSQGKGILWRLSMI